MTPWIIQSMDYTVQARILEWVAFPFSRGSSQPRDQIQVSHIAGRFFTSWATREAQENWSGEYTKANNEIRNYVYLLSIQYMQTKHFERKFNQNFESCYKKVKVAEWKVKVVESQIWCICIFFFHSNFSFFLSDYNMLDLGETMTILYNPIELYSLYHLKFP